MVSELDTGRCVSEDAGLEGRWIVRSQLVGEGNEAFFIIRV